MDERRKDARSTAGTLLVVDDATRYRPARILDLSAGGALVETEGGMRAGDTVKLIPLVATRAKVLDVSARVVRVEEGGRVAVALSPEDAEVLEELREVV